MAFLVDPTVVLSTGAQRALSTPAWKPARVVRAPAHGAAGVETALIAGAARGSSATRSSLLLLFTTTARPIINDLAIVISRLVAPLVILIAVEVALVRCTSAIDVVIVILALDEPLSLLILVVRVSLVIARKLVVIASHICAVFSALTC